MFCKILITTTATLFAITAWCQEGSPDEAGAATTDALKQVLQTEMEDGQFDVLSGFENALVTLAVMPRYPKRALKKKVDGEITLAFDISKHGRAENITVVAGDPKGVFDDEAVDAMQYWAFSPARLATCGTVEQQARQTLRFVHDGDPQVQFAPLVVNDIPQPPRPMEETTLRQFRDEQRAAAQMSQVYDSRYFITTHRVEPDYPLKALDRRKEGMVALAFIIEADGTVGDVEVIDTVAGTYFQRPSLTAIRQWTFQPKMRQGRPVPSVACHEFVFHADEYERSGKLSRAREEANIRTFSPN